MRQCLRFKSPPPTASFSIHSLFAALLQNLDRPHKGFTGPPQATGFQRLMKLPSSGASYWALPPTPRTVGPDACFCVQADRQVSIQVMWRMTLRRKSSSFPHLKRNLS
ncbi:uncharacterized protein TrAFT101_006210 [Trichoderma asperellum]|uniref:uncharacterized protein n=1 Tax=Trichoderma asperellum TaxID=101201 RepID=UPI00331B2C4A|nr:hypothetical protein TrAFT101_006210 [Trichoderma asperellum]